MRKASAFSRIFVTLICLAALLTTTAFLSAIEVLRPYGLSSRPDSKPYLLLPSRADGPLPLLLSQTGAFRDIRNLLPSDSLIPYDLIVPFWSDGATKLRWMSVPDGKIRF